MFNKVRVSSEYKCKTKGGKAIDQVARFLLLLKPRASV